MKRALYCLTKITVEKPVFIFAVEPKIYEEKSEAEEKTLGREKA